MPDSKPFSLRIANTATQLLTPRTGCSRLKTARFFDSRRSQITAFQLQKTPACAYGPINAAIFFKSSNNCTEPSFFDFDSVSAVGPLKNPLPPGLFLLHVLDAARVIVAVHACGVGRQIRHTELPVGLDEHFHGALHRGCAVVVLDAELGA